MAGLAGLAGLSRNGAPAAPAPAPAPSQQIVDLSDLIVKEKCHCLNDAPAKPFANLWVGDDRLVCESDDDEQLLMTFEFREAVRLHSVDIRAPDSDAAPRTVKLYVNKPSIDFAECEDLPATQTLVLSPEDLAAGRVCKVKMQLFSYVTLLTVFVEDNRGADVTQISAIKFNGTPLASFDMKSFKKVG